MISELNEIAELFDEFYFIDEPATKRVKENENPIKINFEGGNMNGLVFIFNQSLSVEDSDMIQKLIHNAMKITMQDIAIVYLSANSGVSFGQMIKVINAKQVVLWDVSNWLEAKINLYEVTQVENIPVIMVDAVSAFHENIPLKTKLWNSIQSLIKG